MSKPAQDRRLCPCRACRRAGQYQTRQTIRRHIAAESPPHTVFARSQSPARPAVPRIHGAPASDALPRQSSPSSLQGNDLVLGSEESDFNDFDSNGPSEYHPDTQASPRTPRSPASVIESDRSSLSDSGDEQVERVMAGDLTGVAELLREAEDEEDMLEAEGEAEVGDDAVTAVIEEDPNFISRERLFDELNPDSSDGINEDPHNSGSEGGESDSVSDASSEGPLPPAFHEHSLIRNAYIHAFANAAFNGATHEMTANTLRAFHSTFSQLDGLDLLPEDASIEKMARTLSTLEHRLGVDTNEVITYFFLCPECWKRHHPSAISRLKSPQCSVENCTGTLYTVKRTATEREKRTPTKVMPFVDPAIGIARMMNRPGMYEMCQHWKKDDDHGSLPPLSQAEWEAKTVLEYAAVLGMRLATVAT